MNKVNRTTFHNTIHDIKCQKELEIILGDWYRKFVVVIPRHVLNYCSKLLEFLFVDENSLLWKKLEKVLWNIFRELKKVN